MLVIPGPKEPKNLKPYLDHMLQEFEEVASQGTLHFLTIT